MSKNLVFFCVFADDSPQKMRLINRKTISLHYNLLLNHRYVYTRK